MTNVSNKFDFKNKTLLARVWGKAHSRVILEWEYKLTQLFWKAIWQLLSKPPEKYPLAQKYPMKKFNLRKKLWIQTKIYLEEH